MSPVVEATEVSGSATITLNHSESFMEGEAVAANLFPFALLGD